MLKDLLSKGYFPKELPAPFNTTSFAEAVHSNLSTLPNLFGNGGHKSNATVHNSARPGTLRRKLSVPNPVNMFRLCKVVDENWGEIQAHVSTSTISMTTPKVGGGERAVDRKHALNQLPELIARVRSKSKYILKADISRFYPSIYTHSIPWAFHSKVTAKSNTTDALFGNVIDKEVRNAQDRQTVGVPIGPDTSLVIAESILTCIDTELSNTFELNGLRYIDDYQLGFKSIGEAEEATSFLQESLSHFELALNPLKTEIIELPSSFESLAISEIRACTIRPTIGGQKSDLMHYFNKSFSEAKASPQEPILKFSVSKLISTDIFKENYPIFENFILQTATAEPSCLSFVINNLLKYYRSGYEQDRDRIEEVLNNIICSESSQGHGNEVANALWGILVLGLRVNLESSKKSMVLKDPFVAILLTDCKQRGLMVEEPDWTSYEQYMTGEELKGDMWVFVYEAIRRNWFNSADQQNPITQHECFNFMNSNGVSFYNESLYESIGFTHPQGWNVYAGSISG